MYTAKKDKGAAELAKRIEIYYGILKSAYDILRAFEKKKAFSRKFLKARISGGTRTA